MGQPKLEPMEHDEQLEGLDQVEVENQIMQNRNEIQRLTGAKKRGEDVEKLIREKRDEIYQLRQQEGRIMDGIEVMDPVQAMNYLEEGHNQTAINLGEPQESAWRKQTVC